MNLNDFTYDLPEDLIAQYPLMQRDQARLLIVDRSQKILTHDVFSNIGQYLPSKSCIVLNDSKVMPARLLGKKEKSGGGVEIFLLKKLSDGYSYEALLRPLKKIKTNDRIILNGSGIVAKIVDKDHRIVRFNTRNLTTFLNKIGHMPLPPYIKRKDEALDRKFYQTVYAREWGSVASPTAGLHFTKPLLDQLVKKGHTIKKLTLHINYGTFQPVEEQDITRHKMFSEDYAVAKRTFDNIKKDKENGLKVVAIGSTSCRVLEAVSRNGIFKGSTNIFIYPGFQFRLVDCLVTNFHLPFSTLLMLVYAFGTMELMKQAYSEAVKNRYRFYSYGDCMLIL